MERSVAPVLPLRLEALGARLHSIGERFGGAVPALATAAAFALLFWSPMRTLVRDWWNDPEASHGLLLAPLALYLVWKSGIRAHARPQHALGLVILACAILLRWVSGLAAELFTMRFSMLLALTALIVFAWGIRQVLRWWLPVGLVALSVPLPAVVIGSLAFPLQLRASRLGAALLEMRHVPVRLSGNVIQLPGQTLFVTEACSGLHSLTALLALGLLIGGIWLRTPLTRVLLLLLALPVGVLLNGIRVFLTGFFVYFVDPRLGQGVLHLTEGWVVFVFAFLILGGIAWVLAKLEQLRGQVAR